MAVSLVQCRCGAVVQLTRQSSASGTRCPTCGALVRGPIPRGERTSSRDGAVELERGSIAEAELDADAEGAGYGLEPASSAKPAAAPQGTWVPLRGRAPTAHARMTHGSNATVAERADLLVRVQRHRVELPGPFITLQALFYVFLYPTWVRWLGLSFMTSVSASVVAVTIFVSWIVIRFQLYLSVFAIAAMAMVDLAVTSYVIACFVEVIEETASGEDRLEQLVDMSWWEILPRFLRVAGAASVTGAVVWIVASALGHWFPWNDPVSLLLDFAIAYQLFPIVLITNLVDSSILPIWSLPATLRRLAVCVGYFGGFQSIVLAPTLATVAAIAALRHWHIAILLIVSGPIIAAWLLFYGHWLGRLSRQLSAAI